VIPHTPTPWIVESGQIVVKRDGESITVARAWREPECPIPPTERDANMHHVAACVNACGDIPTEALFGTDFPQLLKSLRRTVEAYQSIIQQYHDHAQRKSMEMSQDFYRALLDTVEMQLLMIEELVGTPEQNNGE
jgi:hypothetical protein